MTHAVPLTPLAADLVRAHGTPLYVYDEDIIRARCAAALRVFPLDGVEALYALKANANPDILRVIRDAGLGADAVSLGEVLLAKAVGFAPDRISFNGSNVDEGELRAVIEAGVHVCVDGLSQLACLARIGASGSVAIRVNPDIGAGHHEHVVTGGPDAKFGLAPEDIPEAIAVARAGGLTIDGVQQHIGSGILDAGVFLAAIEALLAAARAVPDLRYVDFGGGFGVPYRPQDEAFDTDALGRRAAPLLKALRSERGRDVVFRIEPGRLIVAESGSLLVRVTAIKRTKAHVFVGVDSGFNHLARPMVYGAYHHIENVTNPGGRPVVVRVAGNLCESGDLFAVDRAIPEPREGDVLAIRDAGAYGYSMASTYNLRPRPAEVLVRGGTHRLIRARDTLRQIVPDGVFRAPERNG